MRRKDVIVQIDGVHREHRVALVALTRLEESSRVDRSILVRSGFELYDVRACRQSLEATYLARMFSVFEAHLRDVWVMSFERATHPKMQDLLDGCAARQSVPDDILASVHKVREYRNSVVHGGEADYVPLDQARTWLAVFFGRMPAQW